VHSIPYTLTLCSRNLGPTVCVRRIQSSVAARGEHKHALCSHSTNVCMAAWLKSASLLQVLANTIIDEAVS
jgi:hypothetical protein